MEELCQCGHKESEHVQQVDHPRIGVPVTCDDVVNRVDQLLEWIAKEAIAHHDDLSLDPLEHALRVARHEAKRARKADDLLTTTPVSYRWPDGNPVRLPMRPIDVLRLADEFTPNVRSREGERIYRQIRSDLGAHPKRMCEQITQRGEGCRGWALAYVERAACRQHATAEEREHNRECKDEQDRLLHEAMRALPEPDPEDYALLGELGG